MSVAISSQGPNGTWPREKSACRAVEFSACFSSGDVLLHFSRHAWLVDTFHCTPQTCLNSEVGQVNLYSVSYLLEGSLVSQRNPFEDQPILYDQLVAHAEVRVRQCWGIFLVFRSSYENIL